MIELENDILTILNEHTDSAKRDVKTCSELITMCKRKIVTALRKVEIQNPYNDREYKDHQKGAQFILDNLETKKREILDEL